MLGKIVLSKQGRDKGRYFMVVSVIDDNHIGIADGVTHKVEKPKKKKLKHVTFTQYEATKPLPATNKVLKAVCKSYLQSE